MSSSQDIVVPLSPRNTEADDGTRQHQCHEQDDEDCYLFLHLFLFVCHYVEHDLVSLIHADGSYLGQILDCLVHIIIHDALDR